MQESLSLAKKSMIPFVICTPINNKFILVSMFNYKTGYKAQMRVVSWTIYEINNRISITTTRI